MIYSFKCCTFEKIVFDASVLFNILKVIWFWWNKYCMFLNQSDLFVIGVFVLSFLAVSSGSDKPKKNPIFRMKKMVKG